MKQQLRMEIKSISEDGSFSGRLSTYNNVDQGGDLVEPGAFTKTIQEHGNQIPMLWQHKSDEPIGTLTLTDTPSSLNVEGQLLMELPEARKAYLLIKARIVKGLSIGFKTVKDAMDGTVRRLKEIRLFEGSVVTFPMDLNALITNVKSRRERKDDFSTEFAEQQLQDAAYQMFIALRCALCSIPWASGMSRDEKIAASEASLQQFCEAYMAYIPDYLDWLTEEYGDMELYSRGRLEHKAKKKTKRVDGADLTSDCFAYVGDAEKTDTWKLPIDFPGDEEKTKSHIRNALARFDQTEGIPEGEKSKVLDKIKAAAKKYGIDENDKSFRFEAKAGRKISAATQKSLQSARDHIDQGTKCMKSADDILCALFDEDEADLTEDTSESKAARKKTEPDLHSAAQILDDLKALFPVA